MLKNDIIDIDELNKATSSTMDSDNIYELYAIFVH